MSRLNPSGVLAHHQAHHNYGAMRWLADYDQNVAAWLHKIASEVRQAAKQEAPSMTVEEASTAHSVHHYEARALDAQSDTNRRP